MEHIKTALPVAVAQTTQPSAPLPAYTAQQNLYKTNQIASLVRQAFDIFNTFGKDPDALENMIGGFHLILNHHRTEDITAAFGEWMGESAVMPTPADIAKITVRLAKERAEREARKSGKEPKLVPVKRPEREPQPWDGKKISDLDDATRRAFVLAHETWDRELLTFLLRAMGWDLEGYEAALADLRNEGL